MKNNYKYVMRMTCFECEGADTELLNDIDAILQFHADEFGEDIETTIEIMNDETGDNFVENLKMLEVGEEYVYYMDDGQSATEITKVKA